MIEVDHPKAPTAPGLELRHLSNFPSRNTSLLQLRDPSENHKDEQIERNRSIDGSLPPPSTAVEAAHRWNSPPGNRGRVFAAFFAFLVVGFNDAAYGALIPYLEIYYGLSFTVVSLIFLSPFLGYSLAAFFNSTMHMKFGQRGVAIFAPACHLISYAILSIHPPFPVLVVVFVLCGLGNGLEDAAWSAWVAKMVNANRIQGFLHGCYALGATLSPLIATSMIIKAGLPWYAFYYFMTAAAAVELITSTWAFWSKTGPQYRLENPKTSEIEGGRTKEALKNKVTWICAAFFLGYVGAEVTLGGWIVTFMIHVRSASNYASGISATGFWAGMTVGRATLGFATEHFGERISIVVYLAAALALELIFWLVPQFIVSAVAVALLGFVMGPLFPACIVVSAKLLPQHLHVTAIGFAVAIGGTGGAFFPFMTGAIAQAKGVKVLQPIVLALLVLISLLWLSLPRIKKSSN